MSAAPRCSSLPHPRGRRLSSCTHTVPWRVPSTGARELGPARGGGGWGRAARPGLRAPVLFQGLIESGFLPISWDDLPVTRAPRPESSLVSPCGPQILLKLTETHLYPLNPGSSKKAPFSEPRPFKLVKWEGVRGDRMGHTARLSLSPVPTA